MELELYDLFYKRVPLYVRLPVLFLLLFTILVANGVFLGNAADMASSLGVYQEPYTEAYNAIYIGMGLGFLFHIRIRLRFSSKRLLLAGLSVMLLMNGVCATTNNPMVTVGACLIIGFAKVSALLEVYLMWLPFWSKKFDFSRIYPFVYLVALGGINFITWWTTWLAYTYNWRYAYIWIIILLLVCLLLASLLAEDHPLKRPVPLYQLDFAGLALLLASMVLLNHAVVHGRVENWMDSKTIIGCLSGSALTFGLFLLWELNIRRPLFDFGLLKKTNFRLGLFYVFLIGIFIPGTFQSAFSGGVLRYETLTNIELNLYLIPGITVGCLLCYVWYYRKYDPQLLIIAGFAAFAGYHILLYLSFNTQFRINDFWLPSLLKGFATALLYISIGLYTTSKIELTKVLGAVGWLLLVRSFLGSGIFSGLYVYWLYAARIRHLDYLAGMVDANDPLISGQHTAPALYADFQTQSTLAAAKELSGYIVTTGLILCTLLLANYLYHQLKQRILWTERSSK